LRPRARNREKMTGAKLLLRPKHVWSIRTKLGRARDLAMRNLAIDSELRACDASSPSVSRMAPQGYTADRATVRQRKPGGLSDLN
jgi:hypothetical protein